MTLPAKRVEGGNAEDRFRGKLADCRMTAWETEVVKNVAAQHARIVGFSST